MKCSVQNCNRSAVAHGWCHAHHMRVYSTGELRADQPLQKKAPMGSTYAYYCEHVRGAGTFDCMKWPFAHNSNGRAVMKFDGKQERVHRFACEEKHGPPPSAKHQAAHLCGHAWCVNPNHLRWATPHENNMDKLMHGTHNRGERHNLAKLSTEQVLEIRRLKGVESERSLADRFCISVWHVKSIQRRKVWSWLEDKEAA